MPDAPTLVAARAQVCDAVEAPTSRELKTHAIIAGSLVAKALYSLKAAVDSTNRDDA